MATEHEATLIERNVQKLDLLSILKSGTINQQAEYWNKWLRTSSSGDGIPPEKLEVIERNMNQSVVNSLLEEVTVTGDLYRALSKGGVADDMETVKDKTLLFGGFSLMPFVNDFLPVAKLYDPESSPHEELARLLFSDQSVKPEDCLTTYYALPELVTQIDIGPIYEDDMEVLINELGVVAGRYVTRKKFKEVSTKEKGKQLRSIERQINHELQGLQGIDMAVTTDYFIGRYDGLDLPLTDTITNFSEDHYDPSEPTIPPFVPYGKFVKALYVELEEYGEGVADIIGRSTLTGGVPCIELRDDLLQATYYIPMDEVENIVYGRKKREWWPAW